MAFIAPGYYKEKENEPRSGGEKKTGGARRPPRAGLSCGKITTFANAFPGRRKVDSPVSRPVFFPLLFFPPALFFHPVVAHSLLRPHHGLDSNSMTTIPQAQKKKENKTKKKRERVYIAVWIDLTRLSMQMRLSYSPDYAKSCSRRRHRGWLCREGFDGYFVSASALNKAAC